MYGYNVFAHFRKPGKIIVRLRQEIEGAQIHSKYWPSLSAIPSDRRRYHFFLFLFFSPAKSPLFLRTRPGPALLNYLPCFANTISCINHSNDPSDCQVQESVFSPICLRPGYANPIAQCVRYLLRCFNCLRLALNPELVLVLFSYP